MVGGRDTFLDARQDGNKDGEGRKKGLAITGNIGLPVFLRAALRMRFSRKFTAFYPFCSSFPAGSGARRSGFAGFWENMGV